jgi:hypothetical protein
MDLPPGYTELFADMREWAAMRGCVCYTVQSERRGTVPIFKHEIDACDTDEKLMALVVGRCEN